jgi:hypothetical protein
MTKVNDTARGMPMTNATAAATAMDLIGRKKAPMAICPSDGEPLISTFKYPGAEFVCMVCGGLLGFLAPTPKEVTPELQQRHDELRAKFDAGVTPGKMEVQP